MYVRTYVRVEVTLPTPCLLTTADYVCPQMPAEECVSRIEQSYIDL